MRRLLPPAAVTFLLVSCAGPRPAPRPAAPPPAVALPAAPPQEDWRDVALTPGTWAWRGAGDRSLAQFGPPGQPALFALSCDRAASLVSFSRAGTIPAPSTMRFTTSFGVFALAAGGGGGTPPAIVARTGATDPHLDQLAFSRGRFLVDVEGSERLVLPAWPEVARVVEDCRS